jgi:hypothetical protein
MASTVGDDIMNKPKTHSIFYEAFAGMSLLIAWPLAIIMVVLGAAVIATLAFGIPIFSFATVISKRYLIFPDYPIVTHLIMASPFIVLGLLAIFRFLPLGSFLIVVLALVMLIPAYLVSKVIRVDLVSRMGLGFTVKTLENLMLGRDEEPIRRSYIDSEKAREIASIGY